jgi:hypothetical protein
MAMTSFVLPPYLCELNAIEVAWPRVKRIVRENNMAVAGKFSQQALQLQITEAINPVTQHSKTGKGATGLSHN